MCHFPTLKWLTAHSGRGHGRRAEGDGIIATLTANVAAAEGIVI
jgi:hypothetical protein